MKHPMDRLTPGRKPGPCSQNMERALDLVMSQGWTRTAAAKETGVTVSGISRSRVYQDWAAKQAPKQDAGEK